MIDFIGCGTTEYYKFVHENAELMCDYCKENDVPLDSLPISPKTRNVLRLNRITGMSGILSLREVSLKMLEFAAEQNINEIRMLAGDYIDENRIKFISFVEEKSSLGKNNKDNEANNSLVLARELLSDDVRRDSVVKAISDLNIDKPVESASLSVRSYNCAKRAHMDNISDIVSMYPEKYLYIRNAGVKTADELRLFSEQFVADNIEAIRAAVNGEDISRYVNAVVEDANSEAALPDGEFKLPENLSTEDKLSYSEYRAAAFEYFSGHDIPVAYLGLSVRTNNCLEHANVDSLSGIIAMYPDGFIKIKNAGRKTEAELTDLVVRAVEENNAYINFTGSGITNLSETRYSGCSDDHIAKCIMSGFKEKRFAGLSYDDMRALCPEHVEESQIKHVIGTMIHSGKLEYVDFRCYRIYPSVIDFILTEGVLDEREREVFSQRVAGKTLEEIGRQFDITRERVRQIEKKSIKRIRDCLRTRTEADTFDEDYYEYFYESYDVPKEFWVDYSGINDKTLGYLSVIYEKGKNDISAAVEDDKLGVGLRLRIQEYLDRDCITIDGVKIPGRRKDIQDYVLSVYCRDETDYDAYVELYNSVLAGNGVPFDDRLYITDENKRSRRERLEESRVCLCKYGFRLRYYDIDSNDYTELMDSLCLGSYSDTEISTLKFFEDYPEIMRKYDIRDQYELHNILRKTVDAADYPGMDIKSQPMIRFGEFDRNAEIKSIIETFSPIAESELIDYLHSEYGYYETTLKVSYLPHFAKYLENGIYDIGTHQIPDERKLPFLKSLTEDFYFIRSLRGQYRQMFPDAPEDELNARELKGMGFSLYSEYVLRNHDSLEAYFRYILTKDGVCTIRDKLRRYSASRTFYSVYMSLLKQRVIFLYEPDGIVTAERLSKLGVTAGSINAFADGVYNMTDEAEYFTIHSLRCKGLSTDLDSLGFEDFFLASILNTDFRFTGQRVFGSYVFCKAVNSRLFSIKDFILEELDCFDSIDKEEFADFLSENFGIQPGENGLSKIISIVRETDNDFYYDGIMHRIYRDKSLYYAYFDD